MAEKVVNVQFNKNKAIVDESKKFCVEQLEDLLAKAKEGKISHLTVLYENENDEFPSLLFAGSPSNVFKTHYDITSVLAPNFEYIFIIGEQDEEY